MKICKGDKKEHKNPPFKSGDVVKLISNNVYKGSYYP